MMKPGGGELGAERDGPSEPVQNGGGEARAGADVLISVDVEGTGLRHGDGQLAQAEHDQVNNDGADAVSENGANRAGLMNGVTRTQKEPGPDNPAKRDHKEVPGLHFAFEGCVRILHVYLQVCGTQRLAFEH